MTDSTGPARAATPRGLPAPPPAGTTALPPGTYRGSLVLVTGGGTGLGKAVAAEFARLGADVMIVSRRAAHLEPALEELAEVSRDGGTVTAAVCDIRDPDRIAEVFDTAEAAHGRIPDVLVNNAAANFPVPAEDMSPNAWRTVVDITLNGTFYMTREFGRRHLAAGTPGSVIAVGASYAWTGGPGFAHSAAAKAGVKNLVETLAVEWGPYGILTGDIRANLSPEAGHGEHDVRQPALRVGAPRELGWAATFLASPYARFISGHTLVVDGANWQRRGLVSPPVVTVREQMGRGPFQEGP
ncbi:SDR family oxidoreductase [Streptomyces sp. NPDC005480]|uniref:SDR family oxidoreductase n=1 Tax=Streptomyces sp. NPDC005480 TaxID=3154880 RepID=UPI0033A4D41D